MFVIMYKAKPDTENIRGLNLAEPVTVAEQSKAWTVFACAEAGTVCSYPTQGMDV
jgi:hypothetical protein